MCKIKDSTKKLLGVALLSGTVSDVAAYTNVLTKTSHAEGNKMVAKIGLAVMGASLLAAYVNEKCDIGRKEDILSDDDCSEMVDSVSDAIKDEMESIVEDFASDTKSTVEAK